MASLSPRFLILAPLAGIALLGCRQPAADPSPTVASPATITESAPLKWHCGERIITTRFIGDDRMTLELDGERWTLGQALSASGARYVDDESTVEFWNKGDTAHLTLGDDPLEPCSLHKEAPAPFRAGGNEPAWVLELQGERLSFSLPLGGSRVEVPLPAASRDGLTTRYTTQTDDGRPLIARITERVCEDSMSGMPHPQTVEVRVGEDTYTGCGGTPASLLLGSEWTVTALGDDELVADSRVTLNFTADGQLFGRASCNGFQGGYTLTGEGLHPSRLAATLMACSPELMAQERRFLDSLQAIDRFRIAEDGALVLITADAPQITARRD